MFCRHTQLLDFYPRPPRGGRPHPVLPAVGRSRYFYPRPPRGERPPASVHTAQQAIISIHALREESDPSSYFALYLVLYFYPRPPRGERRAVRTACALLFCKFLSTPSARRATMVWERLTAPDRYFYPRPPRGERRCGLAKSALPRVISIHALREESDLWPVTDDPHPTENISIHALREESDFIFQFRVVISSYFYPRPPRGGRQQKQRENTLLLSHYTPPCTNCKEMSANQTAKSHRYLRKRLVFRCEASRKTMCAAGSHWPDIKKSARYPVQTPGAVQRARPWSGSCCPAGRTADCPRQGRSGRSALL